MAGYPVTGEPLIGQDGVRAAVAALSEQESSIQHALRLVSVIRHADTAAAERVALLRRALALDARVARQAALEIVETAHPMIRSAAASVLASTVGSEDDLPRLLSLMADERLIDQRAALQAAVEAVESPDAGECIRLLIRLVGAELAGLRTDASTLLPHDAHRPQFCRWVSKAWSRAVDLRRPERFLNAAGMVAGILIDQSVVHTSAQGNDVGVSPDEVGEIMHDLRGRPTHVELVRRSKLAESWPWVSCYEELASPSRAGAPSLSRMPVLGAAEIAEATGTLRTLTEGWINAMQR